MKKLFPGIAVSGLILFLLVGLAYVYAQSRDFYFVTLAEIIKKDSGYTISKTGPLELSLLPNLRLTARRFVLSNPASPAGDSLLQAESLVASFQWVSLFKSQPVLDLALIEGSIQLEVDADDQKNWMTAELQGPDQQLPIVLGELDLVRTRIDFTNRYSGDQLQLSLDQSRVDMREGQASIQLNGSGFISEAAFLAEGSIEYDAENAQLSLELSVGLNPAPQALLSQQAPSSSRFQAEQALDHYPIKGNIDGLLTLREGMPYGELAFSAEAVNLHPLLRLLGGLEYLNPEIGPVSESGRVRVTGSDLDIVDLKISHTGNELAFAAAGDFHNLLSEPDAKLKISGHSENPRQLFLEPPAMTVIKPEVLDQIREIELNADLAYHRSDISVSNLDARLNLDGMKASLTGNIDLAEKEVLADLLISGTAPDINHLARMLGKEIALPPQPAPINFDSEINLKPSRIEVLHGRLHTMDDSVDVSLSGSIRQYSTQPDLDLQTLVKLEDANMLAPLFPHDYGPYLKGLSVIGQATVSGQQNLFTLHNLEVELNHYNNDLRLSGEVRQFPANPSLALEVDYASSGPVDLEYYFPELKDMYLTEPLTLSGRVQWEDDVFSLPEIELLSSQTDLRGNISIDAQIDPVRIVGEFHADRFSDRLISNKLDPEQESARNRSDYQDSSPDPVQITRQTADEMAENPFKAYTSSIQIATDWIKRLNLDFVFSAIRAQTLGHDVENLSLHIAAKNGILEIKQYEFFLDGRPISFTGSVDTLENPPAYSLSGSLDGGSLEDFFASADSQLAGGALKGDMDLTSNGDDIGELIANLNGELLISMGPLLINSGVLDMVSSSMLSTLLNGIVKKSDDNPTSRYECGVLGADVNSGVIAFDNSFSLQAEDYNLAGSGEINLNSGMIDIRVIPKAKKGFGLSLSTMVGGFRVRGTMATPDFGVGNGLLSSAIVGYALTPVATASLANPVTGSIVVTGMAITGLYDRITARNFDCEKTLKRIEHKRARHALSESGPAQQHRFY